MTVWGRAVPVATHAASDGNQPILLKNSEVLESPTLAKRSTSQIALGSTISHAGRGKAPPKTSLKAEAGSFSTELA